VRSSSRSFEGRTDTNNAPIRQRQDTRSAISCSSGHWGRCSPTSHALSHPLGGKLTKRLPSRSLKSSLEARDFEMLLVNAARRENVPGRKTDMNDEPARCWKLRSQARAVKKRKTDEPGRQTDAGGRCHGSLRDVSPGMRKLLPHAPRRPGPSPPSTGGNSLSPAVCASARTVMEVLHEERFTDSGLPEVWAALLDEGSCARSRPSIGCCAGWVKAARATAPSCY